MNFVDQFNPFCLKVNLDVKGNFSFLIFVSLLYCCNKGFRTFGGYLLLIFIHMYLFI